MPKITNRKSKLVHVIKRSCLTGKVIWIYHGHSHSGARQAYLKACKKEIQRIRQWALKMQERRRAIMRLLTDGESSFSGNLFNDCMTPEQRAAAKEILAMSKNEPPQDREFYDHIVEEAKRRNWKSERWSENRKKMIRFGKCK